MPVDLEFWKQWEGQTIESEFSLERCTGGDSRGTVFDTQYRGRSASIRFVPGTPQAIEALRASWEESLKLSHPALVQILAHGKTTLAGTSCAFAVTERGDENLGEVLAERPLTVTETRDMLIPVLGALQYLEAKGFAHAGLKPANIMAFGEQVKISSDDLVAGASSSTGCREIGDLLKQVLRAGQNSPLPEPFAEIVRNCSNSDPAERWNLARIDAHLRSRQPQAAATQSQVRWWGVAAAGAIVVGLIIGFWPPPRNDSKPDAGTAAPAPATSNSRPPLETKAVSAPKQTRPSAAGKVTSATPPAGTAKEPTEQRLTTLEGITQVMPDIPQFARNTITGRVRINVRVRVDSTGRVAQATPHPPSGSKYFTDRALSAAQAWKFPEGKPSQDWILHFEIMRDQTRVSVGRIAN